MTHSSQAGLASFTERVHSPRPTLTVSAPSGVAFELRKMDQSQAYAVIGSVGRQSTTAEAVVGMSFVPGDNPILWAKGYAQFVQRALNLKLAGSFTPPATDIIREVSQ